MKKEWIILAVIILIGSLYLAFKPQGRVRYDLPSWDAPEKENISAIRFGPGEEHKLRKAGDQWVIGEPARPVIAGKMDAIFNGLAKLNATDLVSQSGYYAKYELDEGQAVKVTVVTSEGERSFSFGKKASTSNGTYGMMPGDDGVYLLTGDWNVLLPSDIGELRNKSVLSFEAPSISRVSIQDKQKGLTLDFQKENEIWKLQGEDYEDSDTLDMRLNVLSSLNCVKFLDNEAVSGDSHWDITLTGESGSWTLSIFEENEDGFICRSSMVEDPFVISSYQLKNTLALLDK